MIRLQDNTSGSRIYRSSCDNEPPIASSDGKKPHDLLSEQTNLIPSINIFLFSLQAYIRQHKQEIILIDIGGCKLIFPSSSCHLTPFNIHNNLPLLQPLPVDNISSSISTGTIFSCNYLNPYFLYPSVADKTNQKILHSLKELIIW